MKSKILTHNVLFLTQFTIDAKDPNQLKENNITHIVAIHDHAKPELEVSSLKQNASKIILGLLNSQNSIFEIDFMLFSC